MPRKLVLAFGVMCLAAGWLGVPHAQPVDSITYFIADGTGKPGFQAGDRQLVLWALDAWRRAAAGIHFEPAIDEHAALLRLYWTEPYRGRYGEMQRLQVNGKTGAALFVQPDVSLLGSDIAARAAADNLFRDSVVYLTCVHELGHALGLEHTSDYRDIMYFFGYGGDIVQYFNRYRSQLHSRGDIATLSGLSAADERRVAARFASPSAGSSTK